MTERALKQDLSTEAARETEGREDTLFIDGFGPLSLFYDFRVVRLMCWQS